jgi:hypothetical protein
MSIEGISQVHLANTPSIVTSAGDVLVANVNRRAWHIQNVGTNPVFIRLATGASTSVFHFVLKGGTGDSDGNGGSVGQSEGVVYTGIISIAGTIPKVVIMEL